MGILGAFGKRKEKSPIIDTDMLPPPPPLMSQPKLPVVDGNSGFPGALTPPPPPPVQRATIPLPPPANNASKQNMELPLPPLPANVNTFEPAQIAQSPVFETPTTTQKAIPLDASTTEINDVYATQASQTPHLKIDEETVYYDQEQKAPQNLPSLPQLQQLKEIPAFDIEESPEFEDLPLMDTLPEMPANESERLYTNIRQPREKKPLYVRTDYFSQVMSNVDVMKSHIVETSEVLFGLENLKRNADIEHANFKAVLEDMQRKLIYVDSVLFKV